MTKLRTLIEKITYRTPQQKIDMQFHAPNPEGSALPPMPVTQDEDEGPAIRRSQHVQNLPQQDTVYSVIGNTFLADVPYTISAALQDSKME